MASGADPSWGSAEGSAKAPLRFQQGGGSVFGCRKVPRKVSPRFREGSAKVSPKLHHGRFHEARLSFAASLVLWGRSVLRFRGSFHQGSAKFPPSFHQVFTQAPPNFPKCRGVFGSLEQIRLGLPKGSAERSTKVLQVSLMSLVLWGGCVLGCQKVCGRFHGGSTKDSRRPRKFRDLSGLLGQVPFDPERFCRGPPHHFFAFVSQFLQLFFASFWTELALGP